ncbi:MAG: hypothetical protein GW892_11520 [Armatimonadetes bacterium]|nr:hypothetical protein [Armatimonadota bacterium]
MRPLLLSAWSLTVGCTASVVGQVQDIEPPLRPEAVRVGGLVGARLTATAEGRLLKLDEDALLAGFRHRPGSQDWVGEHVGKFLHAATLAWVYTRDPKLREKIDRVTAELLKTQLADGYLGTYTPDQYWTSWDVWVHKYCLYGLLTVHQYTGNEAALDGARKLGDLVCRTFGRDKRDLLRSGTHVGMAATSILEPMVMLYNATGETRYLDFCGYIVWSWSQPHGPHLLESLLSHGKVNQTANGKAYEMMSNLVGLCELYRVTGKADYLKACFNAWQDIVDNRMYLTGGTSLGEHFQADHHLPNTGHVSENCAQVTWEQLNVELLRLTGEARFAEVLETLIYNHLFASQHPQGWKICYFTPLEGTKPYDGGINCCTSSNSRGVALIPTFAYSVKGREVYANLHAQASLGFDLDGRHVVLHQSGDYPDRGYLHYEVEAAGTEPVSFALHLRVPAWCPEPQVELNGSDLQVRRQDGYAVIDGQWRIDRRPTVVEVKFPLPAQLLEGAFENDGLLALRRGPLVYALDEADNPGLPPLVGVGLSESAEATVAEASPAQRTWPGEQLLELPGAVAPALAEAGALPVLRLRPFADAGATGTRFRVWLPDQDALKRLRFSLLVGGTESWSREGNVNGSLIDGDTGTFRVTFDGTSQREDWYAVSLTELVTVARVVYAHGNCYHDGGWFDASKGKPRIQLRRTRDGAWEDAATLDSYPDTTATEPKGLRPGQPFEVRFAPVQAYGVRILGAAATGDNTNQCFSSCAELQAFGEERAAKSKQGG